MTKKRLEYMDMVKGVGILGIVIMHSSTVPLQAIWWISSVAPPLFFLSSGMLIARGGEPGKGWKEILGRKGRSLLLPFLYFSLLYIVRDLLRVLFGISEIGEVWAGVNDLVTLWGSSVLWFLPALFLAESIFIFSRKMFGRRKYAPVWTVLACLVLTFVSFLANSALKPLEGFFLSERLLYASLCLMRTFLRAVYALPFVCAGYFLYEIFRAFWEREKRIPFAGQLVSGIVLFFVGIPFSVANSYFDFRSLSFGDIPVLSYLAAVLSFMGIVLICRSCPSFKPLLFFGKNSLIVMATHIDFYFLYIGLNLANRIDGFIPMGNRVFFFVNVIGVIMILEVFCILAINRFFPFLLGRKRGRRSLDG
ncbi:hypothetical protein D7X98_09930 [bacterium 1XD8-76]|nr:hypothetical protein D7X98_09930 [bacterium 1XD8-76]